jgi:16S rRNA processing protein RimM
MTEILRVVGAFGVRGAISVIPFSDKLKEYKKIFDKDGRDFSFRIVRFLGGKKIAIVVDGINDRNTAESLKGSVFYVRKSDLPKIKENEFYVCDLIGKDVSVIDSDVKCAIVNVENFGAGDLLELTCDERTFFVPFTCENFPDSEDRILITKEAFDGFKN